MRSRYAILLLLACGGLGVSGSGSAAQQPSIKIGVLLDRTGNSAYQGRFQLQGAEIAVREINAAGGVLGRPLEILTEDDQDRPEISATKARKLLGEGAVALMNIGSSATTQQAQTVSLETKTLHLAPSNQSDTLTTRLKNPYFFQTGVLNSIQIDTLSAFARSRYKRVAIVGDDSPVSVQTAAAFKEGLKRGGIEIVEEQVIPRGASDALAQLQRVRDAHPDAIFQAGIQQSEMALFFRARQQLGNDKPVFGSINLSIPVYLELLPNLLDGVSFIDTFDPESEGGGRFEKVYRASTGVDAFSLPAYGYVGVRLLAEAIKGAGSVDKDALRAGMQAVRDFHGAIGAKGTTIGFEPGSRTGYPRNGAVIRVIQNNKFGPVIWRGLDNRS